MEPLRKSWDENNFPVIGDRWRSTSIAAESAASIGALDEGANRA